MKALEIIKIGSDLLKEKKIRSHILDSELLLSKTLNKSREEILINPDEELSKSNVLKFADNSFINIDEFKKQNKL